MNIKGRWNEAEHAVKALCNQACKCVTNGISLYFLSSHTESEKVETPSFLLYENVASGEDVIKRFSDPSCHPRGDTDLISVLRHALRRFDDETVDDEDEFHFEDRRPLSVFMILSSCRDNEKPTEDLLLQTIQKLPTPAELSMTFVQIGDDDEASNFLEELNERLRCKGVDVDNMLDQVSHKSLSAHCGHDFSFARVVQKTIGACNLPSDATVENFSGNHDTPRPRQSPLLSVSPSVPMSQEFPNLDRFLSTHSPYPDPPEVVYGMESAAKCIPSSSSLSSAMALHSVSTQTIWSSTGEAIQTEVTPDGKVAGVMFSLIDEEQTLKQSTMPETSMKTPTRPTEKTMPKKEPTIWLRN